MFSLIDTGKMENASTDLYLPNSMFINGIALNIHADAVNDLSDCEDTRLGIMCKIF